VSVSFTKKDLKRHQSFLVNAAKHQYNENETRRVAGRPRGTARRRGRLLFFNPQGGQARGGSANNVEQEVKNYQRKILVWTQTLKLKADTTANPNREAWDGWQTS